MKSMYFAGDGSRQGEVRTAPGICEAVREEMMSCATSGASYEMVPTCDRTPGTVFIFDNSEGEYPAIKICAVCMVKLLIGAEFNNQILKALSLRECEKHGLYDSKEGCLHCQRTKE